MLKIEKVEEPQEQIVLYSQALREPCAPVTEFGPPVYRLRDRLIKVMNEQNGVGLAANQIAVWRRVAVCRKSPTEILTIVNPEILDSWGTELSEQEGCISIPWGVNRFNQSMPILARVKRQKHVRLKFQNEDGEWREEVGDNLLARIFMHEVDHLNGILFIDHMSRMMAEMIEKRFFKALKNGNGLRRQE